MRRAICFTKPTLAYAGEVNNWHFVYTPQHDLPKGTLLLFDLASEGRVIDWQPPLANPKEKNNSIYLLCDRYKPLYPEMVEHPEKPTHQYRFQLPYNVTAGCELTIILGRAKGNDDRCTGNMAQIVAERRKPFKLFIDPTGKGLFQESETFSIDVRGGELQNIRILAPSFVIRNRRFDVTVRFEDQHGNLTSNTREDALIELTHEHLRENLNWKLFIPETGFITLPNLYFNEAGVYTIQLKNTATGELFRSSPIKCFEEGEYSLFWGLLHGESPRYDSTESVESCFRHLRDDLALHFFASSCFESEEETPPETWRRISQTVADFNEDERFTTFLGFQWQGEDRLEGLRQVIYAKEGKPLLRKKDPKGASLEKLHQNLPLKEALTIPSFTMGKTSSYDFKNHHPDFEKVVEIYNAWGSSEQLEKDGNPRPIRSPGRSGIQEEREGAVIAALKRGCRLGFIAGGLDDRGLYSSFFEGDQEQYSPGLTAIIAKELSRPSLLEALEARRCYATTGERIIIAITLAGYEMGSCLSTEEKPGLLINRHFEVTVAGTCPIALCELICNGTTLYEIDSDRYWLEFEYDHLVPLETTLLKPKGVTPFVFYYLRVTQEDGHIAWSSPIWVESPLIKVKKEEKKKGSKKQEESEDDFD